MTFLPMVHRELRIASRKRGTYVSRAVVAGIVVLLWLVLSAANARSMSTSSLAKSLFWTYGILALLYALLSGVFFTADSLSAERRDGTLGLLFLTDLKGFDVVLGKLAATSWHGVYSLLVIVPVLGLPLLMGGVSYMEMARLVVVILDAMFYSLALGLLISTLCRRLVTVVAGTFVLLLFQCVGPWILAGLLDELGGLDAARNPVVWFCPFTSLAFLPDVSYQSVRGAGLWFSGRMLFWLPVILMACSALGCLGAACWLLPRRWRQEQEPTPGRPPGAVSRSGTPTELPLEAERSPGSRSLAADPALLETSPYEWLVLGERGRNRWLPVLFTVLCLVCLGFLALSFERRMGDLGFSVALFGAFALHIMLKGWLALESSRRFSEDRQSGALELLLVTPIGARDVVRGELARVRRTFRRPLALASTVNLALILVILIGDPEGMGRDRWWFSEIILWGGVVLWLDARAIACTGMLTGLKATRHHRAVLATVARVLLPPWLGVVLFFFMVILPGSNLGKDGFLFCMRAWFCLCGILDVLISQYAKTTLNRHLRALSAGEQPDATAGLEPGEPAPEARAV